MKQTIDIEPTTQAERLVDALRTLDKTRNRLRSTEVERDRLRADSEYTLHMLKCAEQEITRLRAELAEARALVEQLRHGNPIPRISRVVARGERLDVALQILGCGVTADGNVEILVDGARAGLLAAVDEATKP